MCGIFGYLNYLVPRKRLYILESLVKGLRRLEYRGYDSAGIAFDGDVTGKNKEVHKIRMVKKRGKVAALNEVVFSIDDLDFDAEFSTHIGIAHTRWATHGVPNEVNSHPQTSDINNEFVVVHNGIVTNYKDIKKFLEERGFVFESETDTEVIPKLMKYLYDESFGEEKPTLQELLERVIEQLEGAFALVCKSSHYPGEVVASRRGSPLLVGIKSEFHVLTDNVPVLFSPPSKTFNHVGATFSFSGQPGTSPDLPRTSSFTHVNIDEQGTGKPIEYFFASDARLTITRG